MTRLYKRGRFQAAFHGGGEFSFGIYPTADSYLQLSLLKTGHEIMLSVMGPVIGDAHASWRLSEWEYEPFLELERRERERALLAIGPLQVHRRSLAEVKRLETENSERARGRTKD